MRHNTTLSLLISTLLTLTLFHSLTEAFRFTVWLGDKCTITGGGNGTGGGSSSSNGRGKVSDQEILIFPEEVDGDDLCKVRTYAFPQNRGRRSEMCFPTKRMYQVLFDNAIF